jgi:hypothetical protein
MGTCRWKMKMLEIMKHTLRIMTRSSEEIEVRESNIRLDDD